MATTMKIELNGTLITGRIDGTDQFQITIRRKDDDGSMAKSFSSELTFYDDGYNILKTQLIDDPIGFTKTVAVKVWDSCCETPFEFVIKGDGIDWCEPGCFITANLIEEAPEINCVRSTMLWDNHNGFLGRQFIPIRYCIEMKPEFIQYVLTFLTFIMNLIFTAILIPLIAVILVIFSIIYAVCSVISLICSIPLIGCTPPNCNSGFTNPTVVINNIIQALAEINESIVPCGRFHPSPYIRDYITNVCQKCGLTFQSSILNDPSSPYFNTVMVAAQIKKGRKKNDGDFTLIGDNKPVETLATLLDDYLKPVFNGDYRITGGVLIFERKDWFQTTVNWIDTEQLLNNHDIIDNAICYSWQDRERYAYGRFQYQPDAMDYIGNEAKSRWNDIVEWNVPYSPGQSGEKSVQLPISPARFRGDGIDTDIFTFFKNALGGVINTIFFGAFSNYDRALLINQHTFFNYKFLIYNPGSGSDGEVVNYFDDAYTGGPVAGDPDERFNYPFWFVEGHPGNLYSNFHFIDDPRLPGSTQFDFKFEFRFVCDQLDSFDFGKTVKLIKGGTYVNGVVQEMKIDFSNRTITINGFV